MEELLKAPNNKSAPTISSMRSTFLLSVNRVAVVDVNCAASDQMIAVLGKCYNYSLVFFQERTISFFT